MISFITSTFAHKLLNFYAIYSNSYIKIIQSKFCKVDLCYSASKNNNSDAIVFPVLVPEFNNSVPSLQQP